jgi:hypothetical protein
MRKRLAFVLPVFACACSLLFDLDGDTSQSAPADASSTLDTAVVVEDAGTSEAGDARLIEDAFIDSSGFLRCPLANIIQNAGFEDEALHWRVGFDASVTIVDAAHSGTKAIQVCHPTTSAIISQATSQSTGTYRYVAWYSSAEGKSAPSVVSMSSPGQGQAVSRSTASTAFECMEGPVVFATDYSPGVYLSALRSGGESCIVWDDVAAYRVAADASLPAECACP